MLLFYFKILKTIYLTVTTRYSSYCDVFFENYSTVQNDGLVDRNLPW